ATCETHDKWTLIASERRKRCLADDPCFSSIMRNRFGHETIDVGVLSAHAENATVFQNNERRMTTARAASGVGPSPAVIVCAPQHRLAADRIGRDVQRFVGATKRTRNGLRR